MQLHLNETMFGLKKELSSLKEENKQVIELNQKLIAENNWLKSQLPQAPNEEEGATGMIQLHFTLMNSHFVVYLVCVNR